uniref:NR LBD domain-containing protein n=1 Tax=Nothoprocta perdicaria TaxID=30464 RepID=A0A8C6ZQK7_NOTPE
MNFSVCKHEDMEHPRESQRHLQQHPPNRSAGSGSCPCADGRRVVLKMPEVTCRRASEVLLKTSAFIRNLPSFYHVPWEDQAALIQQNWAPLFVLGLAQEGVDFELREISAPSLLKKILLNQSPTARDEPGSSSLGAPLAAVQKMKNLLWKLWDLDLSAREYAYLKGIILFNSGKFSWKDHSWICQEAQEALMDFISLMFRSRLGRFAWILQLLTSLHDVEAGAIEELFFSSILGDVTINELLLQVLHIKPDWL